MASYRCPVCNKPLTKKQFEAALGILESRETHLKHLQQELTAERDSLRKQIRELPKKITQAKSEAQKKERGRAQRLMAGQKERIRQLQERVSQLQKGTTPQTEGLEFEDILVARLKKQFPEDEIQHKGKAGDILHFVICDSKKAGTIIYECKRTPKISTAHIDQAYQAKQSREADFAILVTTGTKKTFTGLAQIRGVLVVAPLGVLPLASLLRTHLIEMLKANITRDQRAKIAAMLMGYVASPQFKNPIEEVIKTTSELQGMILEEFHEHRRTWERRWDSYQRIGWDTTQVQNNLRMVLEGKTPLPIAQPKKEALLLPPRQSS